MEPLDELFFDSTCTAFSLLMHDILNRCGGMKIILSHAGYVVLPPLINRFQSAAPGALGPRSAARVSRSRRSSLNVYFDLAGAVLPNQLPGLLQIANPKKLFYGSDYPFTPAAVASQFAEALEGTNAVKGEWERVLWRVLRGMCPSANNLFSSCLASFSRAWGEPGSGTKDPPFQYRYAT
ncbi:hypothetical protein FIBSPDRAFT_958527 [Athelia psychrophila]|uniref:Uncharacterized protein n=1 Tax=Athelia psychrophila TaxID=1759441 RepID=A0A166EKI6_9AGAM|nr:hypothetical protein FIBSPDRAFT_958527 [Fibularhizoctonia sp. CBS 109695]